MITADELKAHLGVGAEHDVKLEGIAAGVNAIIERETGRSWTRGEHTETRFGTGTYALILKHYPVKTLTSIAIDGEALDVATDVQLDAERGILRRIGGVWPMAERPLIVIAYTGGPNEEPGDLRMAAFEIATYVWLGGGGVSSGKIGPFGFTLVDKALTELPIVRGILESHADSARGFLV